MMKKSLEFFKQKAYEFRGPVIAGILVGTTYIPFPPWAVLFCYIPLWLFALKSGVTVRKAFMGGWLTQFFLSLIGFHWIAHTAYEFGNLPRPVAWLALVLFCAFMHIYVAVALGLATWLRQRFKLSVGPSLVLMALLHSLLERVWPVIFDWNLGYTLLWGRVPLYHLADLIGFLGLSTLLLLGNSWLAYIWVNIHRVKTALGHLAGLVVSLSVLLVVGQWRGQSWNHFDQKINVTVIQGNIGNLEKAAAERGRGYQESITRQFLRMSEEALGRFPQTDIFVWPETAFPDYLDNYMRYRRAPLIFEELWPAIGKPMLVGAYSKEETMDEKVDRATYNALFLVGARGENLDVPYRKTELLAFGEYLPLTETFPIILKWLPFVSNFGRGPGPSILTWQRDSGETVRWGAQICYEGLYPEFSRGLAEKGADVMINVTNDSWFGPNFEPYQHLYMTLARAIEIRRPLVRSTNTGISTAILANGDVLQRSPIYEEWFGMFEVKYRKDAPTTFYVQWGHWDWILILVAVAALIAGGAWNARSRRT